MRSSSARTEKLFAVESIVASRKENNIVRLKLLTSAIKTDIMFGGVLSGKSIVDDAYLSTQMYGE